MRPAATWTARVISVEGGQIRMSANGGVSATQVAIASISASCGVSPFIFQFPAIKGRIFSSQQNFNEQRLGIHQQFRSRLEDVCRQRPQDTPHTPH
jgi:hypothetical protein